MWVGDSNPSRVIFKGVVQGFSTDRHKKVYTPEDGEKPGFVKVYETSIFTRFSRSTGLLITVKFEQELLYTFEKNRLEGGWGLNFCFHSMMAFL